MNILLVFPGFIVAFIIALYYERKIRNISVKPKNKVHFYVARDGDGSLWLYMGKPKRVEQRFIPYCWCSVLITKYLDKYGLDIKDYDNLNFDDEPVEVFLNMED